MLELHIWGPAFGLPSIEPECIAAVAYLNKIIPSGEWTLIADHDTSLSPNSESIKLDCPGYLHAG